MSGIDQRMYVDLDAIYMVAKLKQEVSYAEFNREINTFYLTAKGNYPENIILRYTDESGNKIAMTLAEAGEREECRTIRSVAAVGACIFLRKNDADSEAIRDIYCLGHYAPSILLADRGNIFSNGSAGLKINCRRTVDLIAELMK